MRLPGGTVEPEGGPEPLLSSGGVVRLDCTHALGKLLRPKTFRLVEDVHGLAQPQFGERVALNDRLCNSFVAAWTSHRAP